MPFNVEFLSDLYLNGCANQNISDTVSKVALKSSTVVNKNQAFSPHKAIRSSFYAIK